MDVSQTLEQLKRLQSAEIAIRDLDGRLAQTPGRVAAIEATLEAARAALAKAEAELESVNRDRRQHEQGIEEVKAKVIRHREQQMSVKTNEEYKALNKEIAHEEAAIDRHEEQALICMERADELQETINTCKSELAAEESRVEGEKSTLAAEHADYEKQRQQQADEIARLTEELAPQALRTYRRVAELRGGVALSRLNGDGCGECRVRIRPQNIEELRAGERLVQCELCNRILILPSEAPPGSAGGGPPGD